MQTTKLRALASVIVFALTWQASNAADLGGWTPRANSAPEPVYYSPIDTARWTGAYLGVAGGYSFGDTDVLNGNTNILSFDQSGGLGWIYGGYNWQFGNFVTGVEADIGTGSFNGSERTGISEIGASLNYTGSIRGRAGVLLTPAFLVYGTAGFAWSDMDITRLGTTASQTFTGYDVGAGTELNVSGPWSLRLEYIYTDLSSETITRSGVSSQFDPDYHTVRAGVSYKF